MDSPNCYLCSDLAHDTRGSGIAQIYGPEALEEAILWESSEFYLTPAPGTLTQGYLILAPKEHVHSFACLGQVSLKRVEGIVAHITALGLHLDLKPYVFFEHGSVSFHSRGAACVEHAHLHLVPCPDFNDLRRALGAAFQESCFEGILDLAGWPKDLPYILLGNDKGDIYCYAAPCAPSQFLRRVLARQLGVSQLWNWRLHHFRENFYGTIELLSAALKQFDS